MNAAPTSGARGAEMNAIYELSDLVVSYAGRVALTVPALRLERQRVTAVVGPNGAGKSALFGVLALLHRPTRGRVVFRGESTTRTNLTSLRRSIGYVQQRPYLMKMSVRDNIGLGLRFRGVARATIRAAVDEVATDLGLEPLLQRAAGELSGGEAQKVALARALAQRPEIIIMDEPFTWLDERTTHELENWIADQRRTRQMTVIFSSHDKLRAQSLCDHIYSLVDGRPYPISSGNLFHGNVDRRNGVFISGGARFALPENVKSGRQLFIEPQQLVVSRKRLCSSMRNNFFGEVAAMNTFNGEIHLEIRSDVTFNAVITRQAMAELRLRPGASVWVSFKSSQVVVI